MFEKEEEFISELNNINDDWWKIIKNDDRYRIDLRRMANNERYPELNVYYGPSSLMRIYYTKNYGFRAKIHYKYLDFPKPSKNNPYYTVTFDKCNIECSGKKWDLKKDIEKILKNAEKAYAKARERKFEMLYAADENNNILITEYTGENKENKKDENGKITDLIRVDMVRVNPDGIIELVELKLSNNDELYNKNKERNIAKQIQSYAKYKNIQEIENGIKKHYEICQKLGLKIAKHKPKKLNPNIVLLIADLKEKLFDKNKNRLLVPDIEPEVVKYDDVVKFTP